MRNRIQAIFILFILICNVPLVSSTDIDGDGYDDSEDVCIFVSGNATSTAGKGCPDSDGDGQADFETAVVEDWGSANRADRQYSTGGISRAVAWSPFDSTYFFGGNDGILNHWDLSDNQFPTSIQMMGDIQEIRFSSNGSWLGVVSENGHALVLNTSTYQIIANLSATFPSNEDLYSMVFSNSGDKLWIGGEGNVVSQFDTSSWSFEQNITGFPDEIRDLEVTPDDTFLFTSSMNELRAYWVSNLTKAWQRSDHGFDEIDGIGVSADGRFVATGSEDNWAFVYEIGLSNASIEHQLNFGRNVREIVFTTDGATMLVTGDNSEACGYRTDTWVSLGCFGSFGSRNNDRGSRDIAVDESGYRVLIAQRNGWTSVHFVNPGYLRLNTDFTGDLLDHRWQTSWSSQKEVLLPVEMNNALATKSICEGDDAVGVQTYGYSNYWATPLSNYSQTGLLNCKSSSSQLLEIPIGRIPGVFFVKDQGSVATCLANIGGLSTGQLRWAISSSSEQTLSSSGEMPALDIASITPNSDLDGLREWSDFDASCPDDDILLNSRWENRSEMMALKEVLMCYHCNERDTIYVHTNDRARQSVEFRDDVISGITGASGDGILGYSELPHSINHSGLMLIPLVDNLTHGAADAIAQGQNAIIPSNQSSEDGTWPIQTDLRVFINTDDSMRFKPFMKWLLGEMAMTQLEEMEFVRLGVEDLVNSWARLGVNNSHLLPDADDDGVWDGLDKCPDTPQGLTVNAEGCASEQLDDDEDGFVNSLDDCISVAGNSTIDRVGCPDADGDGWSDENDDFISEPTQWNDTDSDGYGDESSGFEADDCIGEWGNSTIDRLGCPDADGDGWSDEADAFVNDSSEWQDSDGDGYGDNSDDLPSESSQWLDSDGDGYGENMTGTAPDACPSIAGTSNANGTYGCPDSDGDTWADSLDSHPADSTQWSDIDGDGFGDRVTGNQPDFCPQTPANESTLVDQSGCGPSERDSDRDGVNDALDECEDTLPLNRPTIDATGCSPAEKDSDGDGYYDDIDWAINDYRQWYDSDGDGYGDNVSAPNGDACTTEHGTSTIDRLGCKDSDGDGYSDEGDAFPHSKTQWADSDDDGFGDNWGNSSWNQSRQSDWPGVFIIDAQKADRCPTEMMKDVNDGCIEALEVDKPSDTDNVESSSDDSSMMMVVGAGVLLTAILLGVIIMMLRKDSEDDMPKEHSAFLEEEPPNPTPQTNVEELTKVDSWEGLPLGDYMDPDESGTVWFKAEDGSHWWQNSDGSWEKWQG